MRLDRYLAEHGFSSRTKAARAVAEGRVFVNGKPGKAADEVAAGDEVTVRERPRSFVSEGGYKLQKAFDAFGTDARGCVCADLGASTGGFTDCLLQAGARAVYAVDVGKGQLDASLCGDPRVHVLDERNVRYLRREDIAAEKIDIVTADLSFISLKLILPVVAKLTDGGGCAYLLIKPQFECGGSGLNKHGLLKDASRRREIVSDVAEAAAELGLEPIAVTEAPLREKKNVEYIVLFRRTEGAAEVGQRFRGMVSALL